MTSLVCPRLIACRYLTWHRVILLHPHPATDNGYIHQTSYVVFLISHLAYTLWNTVRLHSPPRFGWLLAGLRAHTHQRTWLVLLVLLFLLWSSCRPLGVELAKGFPTVDIGWGWFVDRYYSALLFEGFDTCDNITAGMTSNAKFETLLMVIATLRDSWEITYCAHKVRKDFVVIDCHLLLLLVGTKRLDCRNVRLIKHKHKRHINT